jgi:Cof subfamily protein (haloacid dehalogenase superfamily)
MSPGRVRLLLSDVDGTLVPNDKVLTSDSIAAVQALREADILFALTSARPPQGLAMFVEPLALTTPLAAFNGGLICDREFNVLEEKTIDDNLVAGIVELLSSHELSVWVYQGPDWYVLENQSAHVLHEATVCEFEPVVLADFSGVETGVTKIVGVSDDDRATGAASTAMHERFGTRVLATRSQTYFVDVTHPEANKGNVVRYLSAMYDIAVEEIATIGDMHNDLSMFAVSGISIAMGNADDEVRGAANEVTSSNEEEGFARAVKRFILG